MNRLQKIRDEALKQETYWRGRRIGYLRIGLEEAVQAGMTYPEAADYLGMTDGALRCACFRYGVKLRRKNRRRLIENPDIEVRASIKETAIANHGKASADQIASVIGVSRNSIIGHWYRARQKGELPA